jgi:hypothetical protein
MHNIKIEGLPNRFVLMRKTKNNADLGVVIDFGDIIRDDMQKELLYSFKLSALNIEFFVNFYKRIISSINKWIDNNGGEFIFDETELEFKIAK